MHSKCLILLSQFPRLRVNYGAQKRAREWMCIQPLRSHSEGTRSLWRSVQARGPAALLTADAALTGAQRPASLERPHLVATTLHSTGENLLSLVLSDPSCADTGQGGGDGC